MLSGDLAVEQAPIFDCLSFNPFTLFDDGLCTSEVDVGGCDVADALVITVMIVCSMNVRNCRLASRSSLSFLSIRRVITG